MMGWLRACVLLIAGLGSVPVGATGLLPELDTSSPAATLRSFQAETRRIERLFEAYRAAPSTRLQLEVADGLHRVGSQLFDLRQIPPATRSKTGNVAVGYLADILARLPDIPDGAIPTGSGGDLPPHWTIPGTEIRIVKLTDGPNAGNYVVSAETLARLQHFRAQAESMPILHPGAIEDWARAQRNAVGPWLMWLPWERLPEPLQATLLGAPLWKFLLILMVMAAILFALLRWHAFVRQRMAGATAWRRHALGLSVPILLAALVMIGHIFIAWQLVAAGDIAFVETIFATVLLYLAAAWAVWSVCWLLAEAVIASPSFSDDIYDAHMLRIVARVVSLLAAGGIVIYGANDIGVPALGLLAGVSVGGIALALAAQSTAENLFGGIAIFADRPFRVGDQIRYGAAGGTVESIGVRSTRIRAADGTLTTVPNADLAKAQLTNVSARQNSLFQHRLVLPGGVPPGRLEALIAELRRRVEADPLVEAASGLPRVRLIGFGANAGEIEVEIVARIRTTVASEFLEAQQTLLLNILRGVEACGLDLVVPDATAGRSG
jgi:MscS family membrane protein